MNWKKIQQAWEAGDKQIAVRLLESMIYEMRLNQLPFRNFAERKLRVPPSLLYFLYDCVSALKLK